MTFFLILCLLYITYINAFPPFLLLGPLLNYIFDQDFHVPFTLVVPNMRLRPFWWATLQTLVVDCLLLGKKGSTSVLLFPTQNFRATYSGISGLSEAFLRERLLVYLGFKALEGCSAMPSMFIHERL